MESKTNSIKGLEYQLFLTQDKTKRETLMHAIDAGKMELCNKDYLYGNKQVNKQKEN